MLHLSTFVAVCLCAWSGASAASGFTPLIPLPPPRVVSHADSWSADSYKAEHLLDDRPETEYASLSKGTETFVEVEFPADVRIGAFRHIDRHDPATVAASELSFLDADGRATQTLAVKHVNQASGDTFFVLPVPVSARRVRWRVTEVGRKEFTAVGGAAIKFYAAADAEAAPLRDRVVARVLPFLQKDGDSTRQSVRFTIDHFYAEATDAVLRLEGGEKKPLQLKPGVNVMELGIPAAPAGATKDVGVVLEVGESAVTEARFQQKPIVPLTIYVLPHSHTDIGYTEIQTAIEVKQVNNLLEGIAAARRTATYPEGARFVWNVEVLWAADLYLRRLDDQQRADFLDAVKKGQVVLNGTYLNELTGLCRPEELLRLFRLSTKLGEQTGVPIESAMISDVPGHTWGIVPAMASAGIRYFSTAPNYFDRIGNILVEWENKPFYWVGPDGTSKVLTWIPYLGYAASHRYGSITPAFLEDVCKALEKNGYPYDIAYIRWSGHGDNAAPDPAICDAVKEWNAKYASPRLIISGTTQAFAALEKRWGEKIPQVKGDWTPYWEDGAGSSALETALNRQSSDRLSQAEALFAMLKPSEYPAAAFEDAWNNVLLYSEHTWGAWCSISDPQRKETIEQWEIKRSYARRADQQSHELLTRALESGAAPVNAASTSSVNVFNTLSWTRSDTVLVPAGLSVAGERVIDESGKPVASQRLSSGELAFVAQDVPPFAARRFTITAGAAHAGASAATARGAVLDDGVLRVRVDEKTGGVVELTSAAGLDGNFVDPAGGEAINDYLYLRGDDLENLSRNGPVTIRAGEKGPLVASLVVESDAPGCNRLVRDLRVVAGRGYVEINNLVDKARLVAKSYHGKEGKESVNFAFPLHVPDGTMLMDLPLGVIRPDSGQIASGCKNWFTVGRWVDVSNAQRGITWVTLDSPLVEVGGITANLLNSQSNPDVWRKSVEPTQKFYAWVMNNHWGTNYRAYQEGPTRFRFILRPHRQFDAAETARFAIGLSQPLLAAPAQPGRELGPASTPLVRVDSPDVLVSALKPSDDGRAWVVRLFGAGGTARQVSLNWRDPRPPSVWLSDTSEKRGRRVEGAIDVPAWGLVTVRVER